MFSKFVNSISLTQRLLLFFICSTVLILSIITILIYPPMHELLINARLNHEHYNYLLTQVCIKHFFIGLWCSSLIIIMASFILVKKGMQPIHKFTEELGSINALSLNKRISCEGNPKELHQLALTCNDMLFRIETAFQHVRQFSASMAHELRNPLHYLQTATEITLSKPQTVEDYQNVLHNHLEEYQSLSQLIENLLLLARLEQRHMQLNRQFLSAKILISEVIDYFQALAHEKEINFQISGEALIEVDEKLFKRVLANLIENSLNYTQKGGKIDLIILDLVNGGTQICIKDNGIGIAKEHLPFLCQGFYRVDYNINEINGSLGLGLAIAKSIMELHHGQLIIKSTLNIGTEVLLNLSEPN